MTGNIIKLRNIAQAFSISPCNSKRYELSGRIYSVRQYKEKSFLSLNDGSSDKSFQIVVDRTLIDQPHLGSYVTFLGSITPSQGHQQSFELKVDSIQYLGDCNPAEFPFSLKYGELKSRMRNYPHLRPMAPDFVSLLRIKSDGELAIHQIMRQMDFYKVHTPTLTSNDSEASSDLFRVERTKLVNMKNLGKTELEENDTKNLKTVRIEKSNYFGKDVYLVTSAQLHLEMLTSGLSRVYTLANTFRAENSETRRHLCEFLMFEAEEANVSDVCKLMDRVETIVKFLCQYLVNVGESRQDVERLISASKHKDNFTKLSEQRFVRMTYEEAVDHLSSERGEDKSVVEGAKIKYGDDIGRDEERRLLAYTNNVPIFISKYPKKLKPFYMKTNDNSSIAECFDLIAPFGGEICGGSLRESELEKLSRSMLNNESKVKELEKETTQQDFSWYLDSRRFGSFPHGGFGIGFDRLFQSILGVTNIRDVNLFPRHVNSCLM